MARTIPLDYTCPVCEGAKKWHRDGRLCNLPIRELLGVVCHADHTVCMLCKGIGRVTVQGENIT